MLRRRVNSYSIKSHKSALMRLRNKKNKKHNYKEHQCLIEQEINDAIVNNSNHFQEIQLIMSAALDTQKALTDLVCQDNEDIKALWEETKKDLVDGFHCAAIGKKRPAMVMLRGVLEGFITTLYYREQGIALTLWASNTDFVMAHNLLDNKHEFYRYFNRLFKDERFSLDYPNVPQGACFKEATDLYDLLSSEVHKKRTPKFSYNDTNWLGEYLLLVERVFRIGISFLERVEEIPVIGYPSPKTYPAHILLENQKRKKNGK